MKCPACAAKGAIFDARVFEVRGQLDGRLVRRCVNCDSGLIEGPSPWIDQQRTIIARSLLYGYALAITRTEVP